MQKFVINRDEIQVSRLIGEGLESPSIYGSCFRAFGKVYAGKWRNMNVAVKEIRSNMEIDETALQDFLSEAEIMKSMNNHANVVTFLGLCDKPLCKLPFLIEK